MQSTSHKRFSVSVVSCDSYETDMRRVVDSLLAPLGGISSFVKPGNSVLIKPNLLTSRTPDKAVTTHPEVVRAIIRMVKNAGGIPSVADSPANVTKLDRVWNETGFAAMCREEQVPLLSLEESGSRQFIFEEVAVTIAKPVLDADVIINVPKVKTHVLTIFTGAVKNLYGTIPGFQKTQLHRLFPTPADFGRLLAALYGEVRPTLSIADGIIGMEGEGPSAGRPAHLGFLAASADAVALDLVMCSRLGINPDAVPYFAPLRKTGCGPESVSMVDIVGTADASAAAANFRVPSTLPGRLIPGWLVKSIGRWLWIRPAIGDSCISCGLCVKSCPVNALSMETGEKPVLNPQLCIGCCCCHEVCPKQAIAMKQSPLLSAVRMGRLP